MHPIQTINLRPFEAARRAYIADVFRDAGDDFNVIWPSVETYLNHAERICQLLTDANSTDIRNRFWQAITRERKGWPDPAPDNPHSHRSELDMVILESAFLVDPSTLDFFIAVDLT